MSYKKANLSHSAISCISLEHFQQACRVNMDRIVHVFHSQAIRRTSPSRSQGEAAADLMPVTSRAIATRLS